MNTILAVVGALLVLGLCATTGLRLLARARAALPQMPQPGDLWLLHGWGVVEVLSVTDHTGTIWVLFSVCETEESPGRSLSGTSAAPLVYFQQRARPWTGERERTVGFNRRIDRQRRRHGR